MPKSELQPQSLESSVRTLQIIAVALVLGVVGFLLITLLVRGDPFVDPNAPLTSPLSLIALGYGLIILATAFWISRQVDANALKKIERSEPPESQERSLLATFTTRTIVKLALLEGAAFLNLIVFMLEGGAANLLMAILFLVALVLGIPTRGGVESWLERTRDELGRGE